VSDYIGQVKKIRFSGKSYHANGEVIIDDTVRHWVSLLIFVIRDDFKFPPVQHDFCAAFNVF
jgi:hypothetical protein